MPYFIAVTLLDIACIIHAVRSGRPLYWAFIILAFPLLGAAAYVCAEVLPELVGGTGGIQRAAHKARDALDPERRYRELVAELDIAETSENRRLLAEECLYLGRSAEAVRLYEGALTGLHEEDPALLMGLARAVFAHGDHARSADLLEQFRQRHPKHFSADAHLLYARSLESSGRLSEALAEYHGVARYFAGEEARCRYGLALLKSGQSGAARQVFADIVRFVEKRPKHYARMQQDWLQIAKQHLA